MTTVGLKVLKNKLSEYIRLVDSGETVVVTDRGRIVAEIVPPQQKGYQELREHDAPGWLGRGAGWPLARPDPDSMEERGVREGWLTPATVRDGTPPPRHPIVPLDQLMRELTEDREDR
jgi:prevent-host-death family protein